LGFYIWGRPLGLPFLFVMNWEKFTKKLIIQSKPSAIYNHWLQSELIEKWFLRKCRYLSAEEEARPGNSTAQSGDSYIWEWYNWDGQEKGIVLKTIPYERIVFSFSESEVELKLSQTNDGTLVELTQSGIPTDDDHKYNVYYGCGTAWSFWLANLKAFIEHGIVLHDKNAPLEDPKDLIEFVNV
jgi:uncharacterized protein YndB with AHSA1/START domain